MTMIGEELKRIMESDDDLGEEFDGIDGDGMDNMDVDMDDEEEFNDEDGSE